MAQDVRDERVSDERLQSFAASGNHGFALCSDLDVRWMARELLDLRATVTRLQVLGPDTEARVTCEARAIAAQMLQPALKSWKDKVASLEAVIAKQKPIVDAADEWERMELTKAGYDMDRAVATVRKLELAVIAARDAAALSPSPAQQQDTGNVAEARKEER